MKSAERAVRTLCEGEIREEIANSTLNNLLKERDSLRSNCMPKIQNKAKGWGIWIETIEITELKIASKSVFEDLQSEYKGQCKVQATKDKTTTDLKIQS